MEAVVIPSKRSQRESVGMNGISSFFPRLRFRLAVPAKKSFTEK
jgi:hypothetical protein